MPIINGKRLGTKIICQIWSPKINVQIAMVKDSTPTQSMNLCIIPILMIVLAVTAAVFIPTGIN
ncbi:hypothetical protein [Bacillus sp. T3]|uniref:hypothetical protein n=1 Tax=Bacillus sp. T3 TaxID=467262 RepID=UPI0029829227|nr:hypothetical protein [Bacillus sp. T3]